MRRDDAPRRDRQLLTDAVHAVDGLGLLGARPAQLGEHDVGRRLQVEPDTGGRERGHDHGDLGVGVEGVDRILTRLRALVAADRHRLQTLLREVLLGLVHHVDVLGEEHDLAHGSRELRGVVRCEGGFRLSDPANHREDVLAGRGALRLLELGVGDHADELVVGGIGLEGAHPVESVDQTRRQRCLGGTDRSTEIVVELNRYVGDAAGGDVGGDIHLLASHDAHVDHGTPRLREEAEVGGGEPGLLELVHEGGQRLLVIDPAEELPDSPKVLDRVDQRRTRERHQEGLRVGGPDAARQREHVLGTLGLQVLDEVRLVDDHPLEAEPTEPADVAVEDLVVDDHDVAEGIHVVAVAVHNRCRAAGGPQTDLASPVGLHDVGHDHQQGIRVGCGGGQQRLRRLAEPRLVRQEERAVAALDLLDETRLVAHELEVALRAQGTGLGKIHRGGSPAGTVLE